MMETKAGFRPRRVAPGLGSVLLSAVPSLPPSFPGDPAVAEWQHLQVGGSHTWMRIRKTWKACEDACCPPPEGRSQRVPRRVAGDAGGRTTQ